MPKSERESTLKVIHMGHYAIEKMKLRAKETVYWPGITEDITNTYHQCQICAKFAGSQQKEMLQPVETPHTGWEQLGLDIFSLQGTQYLLTVDYFSQFPVVRKLQSFHSLSVIKILKEIFTTVGIPKCIVSDGGTQFTSQEFKNWRLAKDWQIDHRITSPTNAQSNGQAERFVQTVKNSLTKAMEGGEDLHLAILLYITTTLNHSLPSPAELLNSRKFRCLLPLQLQQPKYIQQHRKVMQEMKYQQAKHYNKSSRDLPRLKTGDAVYIQLVPRAKNWARATIVNVISNRTYKVQTIRGGIYWRNRRFIKSRHSDSKTESKDCSRSSQGCAT